MSHCFRCQAHFCNLDRPFQHIAGVFVQKLATAL